MENNIGIGGLVRSGLFSATHAEPPAIRQAPVVTVSRNFGSNGGKIAELLAARLQVPCYGHSMIDELANKTHSTKMMISLMDEKLPRAIDNFFYSIFVKPEQTTSGYYKNIIKTVLEISKRGGVIIGRGARLILAEYPNVFRVHIEGTRAVCIKRVAQREGITPEEAKAKIIAVEQERSRFLKELFKRYKNNRTYYDLVVNSDRLEPEAAVDLIIDAMTKMGYPHAAAGEATALAQPTVAPPAPVVELRTGMHFLIVEDEEEFSALIDGWLGQFANAAETANMTPTVHLAHATSFKEAEALLNAQHFDLILLDLNLSDSHGYEETFGRLKRKNLDTPIIVFTGLDDDQKAVQAVRDGAQDYLVKGQVSKKGLLRSIRQALARYKIMKTYRAQR
ncbi:MAG: response regulator [Magnetococcales bacterium]|nr:response regulator [Magnetococcales bacterium]